MPDRRYLSVLFSDLVGYTALSERVDPEILRDIQHAYRAVAVEAVGRYDGFVASFRGDGVLAYFGFPAARENDAERAVRAALEIVARVPLCELPACARAAGKLSARVGLHTGLVVLGADELGAGRTEIDVAGMAVNLAARLQAEAPPNGVVASAATLALVDGLFHTDRLGSRLFHGVTQPIEVHGIRSARARGDRSQARLVRGAVRMAGRHAALAKLDACWRAASSGHCQVVEVVGHAGFGKTRLVQEMCNHANIPAQRVIQATCLEIFASTPLYPAVGMLWSNIGLDPKQDTASRRASVVAFLAARGITAPEQIEVACGLLGLGGNPPEIARPGELRRRQFGVIGDLIEQVTQGGPTVLWVEDVHWIDPSSASLTAELVRRFAHAPLLVIITRRPWPPPPKDLPTADETVSLSELTPAEALELARAVPGTGMLSEDALARAVEVAEGVPLFLEQLLLSMLAPTHATSMGNGAATPIQVPISLTAMLSERLDRLPGGRQIAQAAACVGRAFDAAFLAALLALPEADIRARLDQLEAADILRARHGAPRALYAFSHALLHRVAYEQTLLADRRRIHARIATLLDGNAGPGFRVPEVLAHHLTEAGDAEAAIAAWIEAGTLAARRSAHPEALNHFDRALALLDGVTDPRTRRGLELQILAGRLAPLTSTGGAGSAALVAGCRRGLELVLAGEPSTFVFVFLYGLCAALIARANVQEALELARMFVDLSTRQGDAAGRVVAHRLVGMALLSHGEAEPARAQIELSLGLYDPQRDGPVMHLFSQNARVHGGALLSLTLFWSGEVDRGLAIGLEALRDADELRHPHSSAIAINYVGGWILGLCGATGFMMQEARRLIRLSQQHDLGVFQSIGEAALGWALCQEGDLDQGVAILEPAAAEVERANYRIAAPGYWAILADAERRRGRIEKARACSARACAGLAAGNTWISPEVLRVAALLASADDIAARLTAVAARARALGSPVLELRCLHDLRNVVPREQLVSVEARIVELSAVDHLADRVARLRRSH